MPSNTPKQTYMNVTVSKGTLLKAQSEVLVLPVYSLAQDDKSLAKLPEDHKKMALKMAKAQEFTAAVGQALLLPAVEGSGADVLLLVGFGERRTKDLTYAVRECAGVAVSLARKMGLRTVAVDFTGKEFKEDAVDAFVQAADAANYSFTVFKKKMEDRKVAQIDLLVADGKMLPKLRKAIERAFIIAEGVALARDLVNMPGQDMTPERLAEAAQKVADSSDGVITATILDREECEKRGMGAYLAVAQGADHPPKFIHLTYTSPRPSKRNLAVVGKGVTFDSGGLSLKPADGMMTMKCDMAGAAAVIGLFCALARLKPRLNVHGVIAATENMPSGKAIRPGDIVRSSSGKTIEILNTDAEGRLTLADALHYVQEEIKPEAVVDLATLTGACMVALGEEIAGLMTNSPTLGKALLKSAETVGEKMWELPLEKRYRSLIVSDVADLRNIATNRYGGTLTAGLFIEEFIKPETVWAHLDIAGPAFAERPMSSYLGKGGTGYGVKTLVEWLKGIE